MLHCQVNYYDPAIFFALFRTEGDAEDWIDKNQLGRRNLSPDQSSLLRGRRYNRAKKAQGSNNQYVQAKSEKCQNDTLHTADKLAKEHGVSPRTIKRDGKFAEAVENVKQDHPRKPHTTHEDCLHGDFSFF